MKGLTRLSPMLPFYNSLKTLETKVFQVLLAGLIWEYWPEITPL